MRYNNPHLPLPQPPTSAPTIASPYANANHDTSRRPRTQSLVG